MPSKPRLCKVLCDECGETAYYGEAFKGFVAGKVYCSICGHHLISLNKVVEVD